MYCGLCSVCLFSFFSMGFPRIYLMAGACFHHTNNVMFNMLVFLSHTSKFVRLMDIRNCEKKKNKTNTIQNIIFQQMIENISLRNILFLFYFILRWCE